MQVVGPGEQLDNGGEVVVTKAEVQLLSGCWLSADVLNQMINRTDDEQSAGEPIEVGIVGDTDLVIAGRQQPVDYPKTFLAGNAYALARGSGYLATRHMKSIGLYTPGSNSQIRRGLKEAHEVFALPDGGSLLETTILPGFGKQQISRLHPAVVFRQLETGPKQQQLMEAGAEILGRLARWVIQHAVLRPDQTVRLSMLSQQRSDADAAALAVDFLGLLDDSGDFDWRARAACRSDRSDTFFPQRKKEQSMRDLARAEAVAKRVCRGCVVRASCLRYSLKAQEEFGVWGGLTEAERRAVLKYMKPQPTKDSQGA